MSYKYLFILILDGIYRPWKRKKINPKLSSRSNPINSTRVEFQLSTQVDKRRKKKEVIRKNSINRSLITIYTF